MAVVTIGYHPELTEEQAFRVLERHFGEKYEVYEREGCIVIKRSSFAAADVRVEQEPDKTKFLVDMRAASLWAALLIGSSVGLLPTLVWGGLEREVTSFIRDAPEFK